MTRGINVGKGVTARPDCLRKKSSLLLLFFFRSFAPFVRHQKIQILSRTRSRSNPTDSRNTDPETTICNPISIAPPPSSRSYYILRRLNNTQFNQSWPHPFVCSPRGVCSNSNGRRCHWPLRHHRHHHHPQSRHSASTSPPPQNLPMHSLPSFATNRPPLPFRQRALLLLRLPTTRPKSRPHRWYTFPAKR